MYVNATETGVNLEISATGMAVGDTIQLKKNGANFGSTHTVSTAINSVVPEAEVIFLVIAPFVPVNTTFTVLSISAVKLRTLSVASTTVLLTSPTNTTFVKVGLVVSRTIFCALLITLVLPTISVMVAVMVVVLLFELKSDLATLITAFPLVISVVDTTAEIDSTVKVVFTGTNGAITKNITSASGTTEFIALIASDLTTLGEGVVSVKTTATDVAGNTIISNAGNFILDTQAPTAPISLTVQ
jgi:membrane-associated HD superfamily phosphohydrolase